MDCEEVRKYIYAFLDDELDVELNLDVLEHINICAECSKRFEDEKNFKELVCRSLLNSSIPEELRQKIQHNLLGDQSPGKKLSQWLLSRIVLSAAIIGLLAVGVVAIAWGVGGNHRAAHSLELSLMAASADRHIRYLHDELQMEIVSQDPQAVGDYFRTRFPLPLKIRSLTSENFSIVGARLCHLTESREPAAPAACVIYHRMGGTNAPPCTLSLFMIADRPSLTTGEATKIEGNIAVGAGLDKPVAVWRQAGIVSALVADGSKEELIRLARVLQGPTPEHAGRRQDRVSADVARP